MAARRGPPGLPALLVSTDPGRLTPAVRDLALQPDEAVLLRLHGG